MRRLLASLILALVASPLAAQTYQGLEEAPSGTRWIADRSSRMYYPVDCWLAARVPRADRLYFATESAVRLREFARNAECPAPLRLEDEPPPVAPPCTPASPAPASPRTATTSSSRTRNAAAASAR